MSSISNLRKALPLSFVFVLSFTTALLFAGCSAASYQPKPCRPPAFANVDVRTDPQTIAAASTDYGMLVESPPAGVLHPSSPADITALINSSYTSGKPFTVGARGNGHSTYGQSLVGNGVVVNMTAMGAACGRIKVNPQNLFVDAGGEQLWVDVLETTLEHGLAPRSWTDYLYLTVGGTLSNAGMSGQAFRVGPQISNVLEMDVITGKGELITCSKDQNPDLFYAVLGGLGQFGIITRARIALEPAPNKARWFHFLYDDFSAFTKDQEHLISLQENGFDYVEGMVISNRTSTNNFNDNITLTYSLEATKYFNDPSELNDEIMKELIGQLSHKPGSVTFTDSSYFDFLNRVFSEEQTLRATESWVVAHPWLNLFIPSSRIADIDAGIFRGIAKNDLAGTILIYPTNQNKWDEKTSAVIPEESVFYSVSMLRSAATNWKRLEEQNQKILDFLNGAGIKFKQYLAHHKTREEWQQHFGSKWSDFAQMKKKFDPMKILSPGQKIFN